MARSRPGNSRVDGVSGPRTITSLEQQQKRQWRTSIFVDGSFWEAIDTEVVVELGLHEGQVLTQDELDELSRELAAKRAMQRALILLAHRARSTQELSERLTRAGFKAHTVAHVVERLRALGYLDDEEFARVWLKDRMHTKLYGKHRVKYELKMKGVPDGIIEEQLEAGTSDESEYERALKLAEEKVRAFKGLEGDKAYRRLSQFLLRRGFSAAIAYDVCRDVFSDSA